MSKDDPISGVPALKISDLSRLTGVPVSTLRYWCDQRLLTPHVSPKGHRYFEQRHLDEVKNILRLRKVQGLSIAAVKSPIPAIPPVPTFPRDATTQEYETVGEHLRRLRLAAGLTLRGLARETGIDQSTLASIERTSLGAGIPEIKKLAAFYGVTLTDLMAGNVERTSRIIRTASSGERLQPTLGSGLKIEQMASGRGMMDCQRWFVEPGVSSHGAYDHEGEEFIYVLFGQFSITIEEEPTYALSQGESLYFRSNLKHAWVNPGQTTTILLWINTPPTF